MPADVDVNTLKLMLKVSIIFSFSLLHFKSNVLEYRANTNTHTPTATYAAAVYVWHKLIVSI